MFVFVEWGWCLENPSLVMNRCDRMTQNESRDSNGGNVRMFTAATSTSQCMLRLLRAHARLSGVYTFTEYSLTLDSNGVFAIKTYIAIAPATNIESI